MDPEAGTLDLFSIFPSLETYCPHAPTPHQAAFLLTPQREAFFGGAAGGGKSDALLMAALCYVDRPSYAAILFRKTFTDLALPGAIMARAHEWLANTPARWNQDRKTWDFPSGATITFGYLEHALDELRYQGAEFQFVGFDELTQFQKAPYTYLFSRLRRLEGDDTPIRMRSASNPGGVGHSWVRERFIDEPEHGRIFIPSKLYDNPHLDQAEYRESLGELSPVLQQQLLDGDWRAFEGRAYADFREELHVVAPFPVPAEWTRFEFMDHGTANPTAWFLATTDTDGNTIVVDSYYSPGLVSLHVREILARREAWYPRWTDSMGRTYGGGDAYQGTIADPAIRSRTGATNRWGEPATTQTEFHEQSEDADGKPRLNMILGNNDRRAGRLRIAEMLAPKTDRPFPPWHPRAGEPGAPELFVMGANNIELVKQLETAPLLPIDAGIEGAGEIVDPKWESRHGHAVAALRYGAMARTEASDPVDDTPEDPRREALQRFEKDVSDGRATRLLTV